MARAREWVVYEWIEAGTGETRYIGQTCRLKERIHQHLSPSPGNDRPSAVWFREQSGLGTPPVCRVLSEHATHSDALDAEKQAIAWARAAGCPLTNSTDGGEGTIGWSPAERWRAKKRAMWRDPKNSNLGARIGDARRGEPLSAAHRASISASSRGQPRGEEYRRKIAAGLGQKPFTDNLGRKFETLGEAAAATGADRSSISKALRGKIKHANGFRFTYHDPTKAAP